MLTNQPRSDQPNDDFFGTLPVVPTSGSTDRTPALIRGHLIICRDEGGIGAIEENMTRYEAQIARDTMRDYQRLMRADYPEMSGDDCAIFAHTPRIMRDVRGNPTHINFLVETRDSRGWLSVSTHGVNRYIEGPVFTHVQASFANPTEFAACPLFSFDAFREELLAIDQKGSRMALGHRGSSYILSRRSWTSIASWGDRALSRVASSKSGQRKQPHHPVSYLSNLWFRAPSGFV